MSRYMLAIQTARRPLVVFGVLLIALLPGCTSSDKPAEPGFRQGDSLTSFSEEITSPISEFTVKAGDAYPLNITVKNTGTQPWYGGAKAASVDASYRWVDAKGKELPIEGNRVLLSRPVIAPGESDKLTLPVLAPPGKGHYDLSISMVQEAVAWFYHKGAKPLVLRVTVE